MDIPFRMKSTITVAAVAAGGVGTIGAFLGPGGDVPLLAPIWISAAVHLADQAGQPMEKHLATKLVTTLLAGVGSFAGGMKLATTYFTYSGIGTIPGIVVNVGTNGVLTWLALRAMAQVFIEQDLTQSIDNLARSILSVLGGMISPQS